MRQKVALTAAHLLCEGRIADMGMGSGTGSQALASLYPALEVIGVDISATMVELAAERHRLPNLRFIVGDIAQPVFPDGSLDGIFDSSVLHHVTSFSGYAHDAAAQALSVQARALRPHGVLVIRDFLSAPAGEVLLDLRADDGDDSDDPRSCSTASLFRRFSREFRSLHATPGFVFTALGRVTSPLSAQVERFRLAHRLAVEFVLRKDYRTDWESEVKEEYTYFTQSDFEQHFARLGLRVLASVPLYNPWIVHQRFDGQLALHTIDGAPLPHPATNYVIAGERVPPGEGVRFVEAGAGAPAGYLEMDYWRERGTDRVFDLARRPHLVVDVLPWFELEHELFVLARKSYPRPILQCDRKGSVLLGDRRPPGYVTEPLSVMKEDRPLGLTVEDALWERAHIAANDVRGFSPGATYYPSPGGIMEEVRSMFVEIAPRFVEDQLEPRSGFSTSGMVRAIEARQLLRAAQVGGLPDARLELNVYALLRARGLDAGPWIGETLAPTELAVPLTALAELRARPRRRRFERAPASSSRGFLELRRASFEEKDANDTVVARRELELVTPLSLSLNTIVTAPLARRDGRIYLGVDDFDLPAAQGFNGNSNLLVAPAWRLPREVTTLSAARAFVTARLTEEYGVVCETAWELGGPYHPSPGLTPEVVQPFAMKLGRLQPGARSLCWVALEELLAIDELLVDGHLRIVAHRAAHALGLLD